MSLALDDAALTPDDPLTTKEGWRQFVEHQPEPPLVLDAEQPPRPPTASARRARGTSPH
jgi:hypothetical protein